MSHRAEGCPASTGPNFLDEVVSASDRLPTVLRNLQMMFDHGRLGGTGYLSILPVDQGVEHSAGASVAPNPLYFDPENIVTLNHNELLSYPNTYDQRLLGSVEQVFDMGVVAVGATVYFGSEESRRQIEEISEIFEHAHDLGMFTGLWAYLRNEHFEKEGVELFHAVQDVYLDGDITVA